jgi:hypothetical protein
VRYKLLNIGLLTAGIGHCLVLQVGAANAAQAITTFAGSLPITTFQGLEV